MLLGLVRPHSHDPSDSIDDAMSASSAGIRALKVSLLVMGLTALFQLVIVVASGSSALLADTVHNLSDALTSIPLWIAFRLGRRPPDRAHPYGYGRAEDVAGIVIIGVIALSVLIAGWESIDHLLSPRPIENLAWVALAGVVGFLGNEAVAIYRIRVGTRIGSAALVADGHHARVDGLTSLAVVVGAAGVAAGFPAADPLVGLLIVVVILFVARDALLAVGRRLMDIVDPELIEGLEAAARQPGVERVERVRARWVGHRLDADAHIVVDEDLTTAQSHAIAETVRHALVHAEPKLRAVTVHVDPCGHGGADAHATTSAHLPSIPGAPQERGADR
jgi:cation diffusion facilitator family transporter